MSMPNTVRLLKTRKFLPLFLTQFLGALNDNFLKQAIVILIVFSIAGQTTLDTGLIVTLVPGAFVLPFFLFSALAGQFADRFEKANLIRLVKAIEIPVVGIAAVGFLLESIPLLLSAAFLMGTQSAFFGPLKYAILPERLTPEELPAGNALVESGTFLAILVGTVAGGLIVTTGAGPGAVAILTVGLAIAGLAVSLRIPVDFTRDRNLAISFNIVGQTWGMLANAYRRRDLFLCMLGISWFWFMGMTYLSQFPVFIKDSLGGNEEVVTLFLILLTIGIGFGSLVSARLMAGETSAKFIPLSAIAIALFNLDLYLAIPPVAAAGTAIGAVEFLAAPAHWRMVLDLFGIAFCGGVYTVPLYSILQARAPDDERARMIAANNVMNAAFMVASAGIAMFMLSLGFGIDLIFLGTGILSLGVAVIICRLLPLELVRSIAVIALKLVYRVEVRGRENLTAAGPRSLIVANHVSLLDGALMAVLLPGRATIAIDTHMAEKWWVRPWLKLFDALPMDPAKPMSAKRLVRAVRSGSPCVIFPEGRITTTGALMKVYEGPGMVADKADASLVPVRIDGAERTRFSYLNGKRRISLFPKITITILPPRHLDIDDRLVGRTRRKAVVDSLYDLMSDLIFDTTPRNETLFEALLDARQSQGGTAAAVEDQNRRPLSYNRLIMAVTVLGRRIAKAVPSDRPVGLMLPSSTAAAVTFFACTATGRVPAMLNFSAGTQALIGACTAAEIETILTSRLFVERARLEPVVETLAATAKIIYLEDLRTEIGVIDKLAGLLSRIAPRLANPARPTQATDPAVILFTSGSEGTPKGVVLSHRNIIANCRQLAARIDFTPSDVVFNALPVFHAFGLTGGLLLPMLSGIRSVQYPSPLHYRIVPEMVYASNATVMFGTDTFLAGYARVAHPYDFYSVRYAFAGAERVRDETRRAWMDKFGVRVLEGYGATECAPVLAVNTPMHARAGTVGRLLPGLEHRLDPVPGISTGGRLSVRGPNVMLGYLKADRPGVLQPPADGWYDTGDIVEIDQVGFITIKGRAKRFAKIAGEMVSLSAVEALVERIWPDHAHAVVALPDARKGEQIVLVTDRPDPSRDDLIVKARDDGASELIVPRTVVPVDAVPILGSGKTDYAAARDLAATAVSARAAG